MKKLIASLLSGLYRVGLNLCQASYRLLPFRMRKVNARVISIGNITWGGTGKTPLTIKLAGDLFYYGRKVAVLTRGYGKDEVDEIKTRLPGVPVIVGRDRIKSAHEAIKKHGAEFLILDDAFQHIRLRRDLDIVTVNCAQPFGPGGLIPAGTLREPVQSLARAHVFVLTKSDIGVKNLPEIRKKLTTVNPTAVIYEAVHKPVRYADRRRGRETSFSEMSGRRVAVVSGIGDPFAFEKTVEHTGAEIVFAARFDDHHVYTKTEVLELLRHSREIGAQEIVTTEKDYFRLQPVLKELDPKDLTYNFLVLEIEFQISDEEDFLRRCLNSSRR